MKNNQQIARPIPCRFIVLGLTIALTCTAILAGYYQDLYRQELKKTNRMRQQLQPQIDNTTQVDLDVIKQPQSNQ